MTDVLLSACNIDSYPLYRLRFSPGFVHKANIATSLSWKHVSILITLRRSSAKSGEEQSSYNVERLILYYYFSSFWFPRKAGLMRLDKKNATFHFPFLRKKTQHIPILLISLWMVGTGPCRFEGCCVRCCPIKKREPAPTFSTTALLLWLEKSSGILYFTCCFFTSLLLFLPFWFNLLLWLVTFFPSSRPFFLLPVFCASVFALC